jgi:hypothetical protein
MIRASIGKAVSAMQAPVNSVALVRPMFAANRPGTSSRNGVMTTAIANGAAMPETETAAAARLRAEVRGLNVSPTRNM